MTNLSSQGDSTLQTKNKKLLAVLLGWVFVALGVIGVVLPILPGIPLLLVGLFVLSLCGPPGTHRLKRPGHWHEGILATTTRISTGQDEDRGLKGCHFVDEPLGFCR